MRIRGFASQLFITSFCGVLAGCGAVSPYCSAHFVVRVEPSSAIADHLAKAPGNQQQFQATGHYEGGAGCPVANNVMLEQADWAVSDPAHVQISSAKDGTNGLATCVGETAGAVTLTAGGLGTSPAANALITCK